MYDCVTVLGILTKDPVKAQLPTNGNWVVNFVVAVRRGLKDDSGTIEYRVSTSDPMHMDHCMKYLKAGSEVLVVGKLVYDHRTRGPKISIFKETGEPKAWFAILAKDINIPGIDHGI